MSIHIFRNHEKFLDLWDEVGEVAKAEEASSSLKFGIVDCHEFLDLCIENQIRNSIELRFFGDVNYWPALEDFLDNTIADVLREDELIKRLDQPGNLFVLFKVSPKKLLKTLVKI